MREQKPEMDEGLLIIDRAEDQIEPRYLVELYVEGEVIETRTYPTHRDLVWGLATWTREMAGAA